MLPFYGGSSSGGISSLNALTGATQTFTNDTNFTIVSGGTAHVLTWSGTLSAARGGTGLSSLGTGVATFLGTPSSANLAAALTDETGSGAAVFATSPTLVTPALGTPASGVATNLTGLPLTTGVTGVLPIANGGTASATQNFVDISTTQSSIAGAKTWTAATTFSNTISFSGTDANAPFTSPNGNSLPAKIAIAPFVSGTNSQIFAFGLSAGSSASARTMSIFDNRAGTHYPTFAVWNLSDSDVIGPSWEGSNTDVYIKTISTSNIWIRNNDTTDIAKFSAAGIRNILGHKRITANVTNATTTMSNLTDLSTTLVAGNKYAFKAVIFAADDVAVDGLKIDFDGGTATLTSLRAAATIYDTALLLSSQSTALATDFAAATTTGDTKIEIDGAFVCNAAGTFIPRFAQNSHTTGTATVYLNSYIWIWDSPN